MTCVDVVKEELRPRNFWLRYHRKDVFYKGQLRCPPVLFIVYRVVAAIYLTVWLGLVPVFYSDDKHGPFIWFTAWSFFVLCCHLVLAAIITLVHIREFGNLFSCTNVSVDISSLEADDADGDEDRVPWYIKIDWMLFTISAVFAPIITAAYYSVIYPYLVANNQVTSDQIADVHAHVVNTVVILLEFILFSIPWRFYHFIYVIAYSLLYLIFTVIYWATDHQNILYAGLVDWNQPGKTLSLGLPLILLALPLFHIFLFALYKLKVIFISKICHSSNISHHGQTRKDTVDVRLNVEMNAPAPVWYTGKTDRGNVPAV